MSGLLLKDFFGYSQCLLLTKMMKELKEYL